MDLLTMGAISCLTAAGYNVYKKYINADHRIFKRVCMASWHNYKMYVKHGEGEHIRYEDIKILKLEKRKYGYWMKIELPSGLPYSKFKDCLEGLEMDTWSKIRIKSVYGRIFTLEFGRMQLREKMNFRSELVTMDTIKIPLFTPFGIQYLDFADESSCHALSGGATRMGKTSFFRLLITLLLIQTNGYIKIVAIDNKINDLHMFKGIRQVDYVGHTQEELKRMTLAETIKEAEKAVYNVLQECNRRKKLLTTVGNCVDIREYREKYPGDPLPPIFVIIDEFGRFSGDDGEWFQEMVTEVAETAGYLDVHLIISAQRPDARDVLKPRIKNNLLVRLAFTTTDEANSIIILDTKGAENLGGIQGRAILKDGLPTEVQVPYISSNQVIALLTDANFYVYDPVDHDGNVISVQELKFVNEKKLLLPKEDNDNGINSSAEGKSKGKGRTNHSGVKEVQSDDKGSDWENDLR